jgi:hypothetical protein
MDRIVELVQLLEPEMAPPPPDLQARQRDALLRFVALTDKAPMSPPHPRPHARHSGWYIAIAGAAAVVAVVAAVSVPGSFPPRPPVPAPGTSAVLTAVTGALANVSSDIEEVQSSAPAAVQLSRASWVDLATGACRTDTSVNGQPVLTVFVKNGSAVVIDYGLREWWTRGNGGVTCEPLTPQAIEQDLKTGNYTLAGRATVDGQQALKLVSTTTTAGPHRATKSTTLWVNATNYLPIQSVSVGHVSEQTTFAWMPATSTNAAMLNVTIPAGFRQVVTAPIATPSGP